MTSDQKPSPAAFSVGSDGGYHPNGQRGIPPHRGSCTNALPEKKISHPKQNSQLNVRASPYRSYQRVANK
jgi:hypothetical protein